MWPASRLLKYSFAAGTALIVTSSYKNSTLDTIGIVRLGRAASAAISIAIYYKQNLYAKKLKYNSPEYVDLRSKVHKQAAEKLLELCCLNKGVYIKVGQHIGAMDYLLPSEYVQTMKVLHSHAPCSELDDIYQVIREDFNQEPLEIFSSFDPTPLGAASLAQVHKATLKDGSVVAVKVQHRRVKKNSNVDLKTMEMLVTAMTWIFPDFNVQCLVDETKKNIPKELDFTQEGRNAEKIASMFENYKWLKVPKVHWNLTTERVLTMEFLEGGQVDDLQYIQNHNINPYDVANKLGHLYSQMIFIEGFVHSDPHPGNVLVKKTEDGSTDIILLDHGLYAVLSDNFRYEYSQLWLSILNKDKKGMQEHSEKLGVGHLYFLFACMISGRTWDAIMSGIDKKKYSDNEKSLFQKEVPNLIPKIMDVLSSVNSQMLLVLKTNDLIRGIEYNLNTQSRMTSFLVMSKCCARSVHDEEIKQCQSTFSKFVSELMFQWTLLKLNMYYTYLSITDIDLKALVSYVLPFSSVEMS